MVASVALVHPQIVNLAPWLFVSVGVSLCKEEIGAGLVVTVGVGRFAEVVFEVSVSVPPPLVSFFKMWGGEPGVTGLCLYLCGEVH